MINEELTFQRFGYQAKDLSYGSSKRVVVNCDKCGLEREVYRHSCKPLCKSCSTKGKNLGKNKGKPKPAGFGEKISKILKGKKRTEEFKRKLSLDRKGKPNLKNRGENHYRWKGGITPLHTLIRASSEYRTWYFSILKRDNYTCQECGKRGGKLEIHHLREFSQIFKEFLQTNNQFSPIEDKETLLRLASKYLPFWDINNGKVLCYECHALVKK